MIRIIVREVNTGAAIHIGGPVDTTWKTFDIFDEVLEAHLLAKELPPGAQHVSREVVGVEVLAKPDEAPHA